MKLLSLSASPRVSALVLRRALIFYRITSIITGVLLLLLVAEMIFKYGLRLELFAFSPDGFLYFYPLQEGPLGPESSGSGFNVSTATLIVHGWFYVVYLISDFRLWSFMRWKFSVFILIALGGVIPLMSFIVEHYIQVKSRKLVEGLGESTSGEQIG